MASVEEFIIKLRDRFTPGMRKAKASTDSLRRSVNKTNQSVGKFSGLLGTAVGAFATFAAASTIKRIVEVGSSFEQLQISFETMLGSAQKATVLIKDLVKFAKETPFELQDVAKGAKSLLAFGIAQEKILPNLKALGDVAAGLSVPIGRLILNFGQVRAQQKLTGRELRDFAIAGVPLLDELAKVLEKTPAEITKLVSEGKIGFPVVEKAFKNMSSEGGKFFNLMHKQTASTGGQLSNLKDIVDLLANDAFLKLQSSINAGIEAFKNMIAILREAFKHFEPISEVMAEISFMTDSLSVSFRELVKTMGGFLTKAEAGALLSKTFAFAIRSLTTGIRLAIAVFDGLFQAFNKVITRFPIIGEAIKFLIADIGRFIDAILFLPRVVKGSFSAMFTIIEKFGKGVMGILEPLGMLLLGISTGNIGMISAALEAGKGNVTKIKAQIKEAFNAGFGDLGKKFTKIPSPFVKGQGLGSGEFVQAPKAGPTGGLGPIKPADTDIKAGIAGVRARAPKTFNITIDSLIEKLTFNTQSLPESTARIKEAVTQVLLTAVNDTQIIAR